MQKHRRVSRMLLLLMLVAVFGLAGSAHAQGELKTAVITPENVGQISELVRIGDGIAESVLWSPNGGQFAVLGGLGVWLYDANNLNAPPKLVQGFAAFTQFGAYSADGSKLFVLDSNGFVYQVDVALAEPVATTLHRKNDGYWWLGMSEDGAFYAVGDTTGTLTVVRTLDGVVAGTLAGLNESTAIAALKPDGTQLAAADSTGVIIVWDVASGQAVQRWEVASTGSVGRADALAFSREGLVAVAAGNTIHVWNANSGQYFTVLPGHAAFVSALVFDSLGRLISTSHEDGTTIVWHLQGEQAPQSLRGYNGAGNYLAVRPDGKQAAIIHWDSIIEIWDLEQSKLIETPFKFVAWSNFLALRPDARWVANSGLGRHITIFDALTSEVVQVFPGDQFMRQGVAFSPDGRIFSSLTDGYSVAFWDTESRQEIGLLKPGEGFKLGYFQGMLFSPDGSKLALGGYQGASLWDVGSRTMLYQFEFPATPLALAFSSDGSLLAAASNDGLVRIWQTADGALRSTISGHTAAATGVAFSPDGRWIASSSEDKTLRVLDVQTGELVRTILAPADSLGLLGMTFNPSGTLLVAGDWNGALRIWRTDDWSVAALQGHKGGTNSVAFSADGTKLVSLSYDGTIRLWGVRE